MEAAAYAGRGSLSVHGCTPGCNMTLFEYSPGDYIGIDGCSQLWSLYLYTQLITWLSLEHDKARACHMKRRRHTDTRNIPVTSV